MNLTTNCVRRLTAVSLAVSGIVTIGTVGYTVLEDWPIWDSFFMTVITMSTVGYGLTHELSDSGKYFTAFLIFFSLVGMTGWTATLTSLIVESDLAGEFSRRRIFKMISKLKGHTIICGSCPLSLELIDRMSRAGTPFVVIDDNQDGLNEIRAMDREILLIEGVPTDELVLASARLLHAKSVVAVRDSAMDNLLISITCKELNENLDVFAYCDDTTIANRMRKAGVNEVIAPYKLGGERLSELLIPSLQP